MFKLAAKEFDRLKEAVNEAAPKNFGVDGDTISAKIITSGENPGEDEFIRKVDFVFYRADEEDEEENEAEKDA